ncbi:CD209 antigen-like protein E [Arapaima gigas]
MTPLMKVNSIYCTRNDENVYVNKVDLNDTSNTKVDQTPRRSSVTQPPGAESTGGHCYRRVSVCLGLLCVLLFTALIVVTAHYIAFTYEAEVLKADRDHLWINYSLLVSQSDHLMVEREALQSNYSSVVSERDQLTVERDQLLRNYSHCTAVNKNLTESLKVCPQGWRQLNSMLYYISTEKKSWASSRQHCRQRGGDLVIISSQEEQNFISKLNGEFWIGLSDTDKEGTWKWVDGTTVTKRNGYWMEKQPDDYNKMEDCAVTFCTGVVSQKTWNDIPCHSTKFFICEKKALSSF